jgi:oxalate decarboxylase/phosphoglucose isomerase-like protein (cupin superfamily)
VAAAAAKLQALKDAATEVAKISVLEDSDFVFNFNNATVAKGNDGDTIAANVANFPVLLGEGLSMTVGLLGPCGMNSPHTHPRATEILYLINGTIITGMLQENGARFVYNTVQNGSAQVFLKGSIHYQQNVGCEPVTFVAALNNEDPGVNSIAQRYFGLPPDIVGASLGGIGVQEVAGLEAKIPDNIIFGIEECLQRCNIQLPNQTTNQRQPRVSGNALPSGFSGPPAPSSSAASSSSSSTSTSTSTSARSTSTSTGNHKRGFEAEVGGLDLRGPAIPVTLSAEQQAYIAALESSHTSIMNVALIALVAVMASGYVVIALGFARGRRQQQIILSERSESLPVSTPVQPYSDRLDKA